MPILLSLLAQQMWQYRWLNVVLGEEELARITVFGQKYNWGEAWKVRFYGAIASAIASSKERIAQDLISQNLTLVPNLIIPDTRATTIIPKNKLRKAMAPGAKGLAKSVKTFVGMMMPLSVYKNVVEPVLSEQEIEEWNQKIEAAGSDAVKLTEAIASWMMLVRSRHGSEYEQVLAQTRENVTQELFDFVKDTLSEYKYLSKQKRFNKYEELVATQDVEGLVDAYLAVK